MKTWEALKLARENEGTVVVSCIEKSAKFVEVEKTKIELRIVELRQIEARIEEYEDMIEKGIVREGITFLQKMGGGASSIAKTIPELN